MSYRTFIASILVAAMTITGWAATPARADSEDIAKVIAGVAALAIIGAAISERNDRNDYNVVTRNRRHHNDHFQGGHRRAHKHKHKHNHHNDRFTRRHRALPGQCQTRGWANNRVIHGLSRRCLINNYSRFNALPHECARRVVNRNGRERIIYSNHCLDRRGFRIAGRY